MKITSNIPPPTQPLYTLSDLTGVQVDIIHALLRAVIHQSAQSYGIHLAHWLSDFEDEKGATPLQVVLDSSYSSVNNAGLLPALSIRKR